MSNEQVMAQVGGWAMLEIVKFNFKTENHQVNIIEFLDNFNNPFWDMCSSIDECLDI
jgi:hypothetical protein